MIHPDLQPLVVNIDELDSLSNNPRVGDVAAIKASLMQFGQMKPIVIRPTDDGRFVIIAGNHTVVAARELGWKQIAAVKDSEMDEAEAIAFALVDNRVSELGHTVPELLAEHVIDVADVYPDIMESVGWDDFEIASMESAVLQSNRDTGLASGQAGGYTPPQLVSSLTPPAAPTVSPVVINDEEDGPRLVAPSGTDERAAIIGGVGGATSQSPNSKKASIQYTLIFDDSDQMARWWDFVKFLRSSDVYVGETITERMMDFLEAHGDF